MKKPLLNFGPSKKITENDSAPVKRRSIALKELAAYLGLSQSTVSRVINGEAKAHRIAEATQKRVLEAAARFGYEANIIARSLRQKRTFTVGVLVPEISEGYSTAVLAGIEDGLLKEGLFYFVASHRHHEDLLEAYPRLMISRAVDGIIAVDTKIGEDVPVPVVAVSGHWHNQHAVSVELDHRMAAHQALEHLQKLGHKRIAFIKGQAFSSDTSRRWKAIRDVAGELGIAIIPGLTVQLKSPEPGPEPGHLATQELLAQEVPFTALFCFNDMTAFGAVSALREAGLQVPRDVSVVGFDDVLFATSSHPPLTTIRQPLRQMGQMAASTLLGMIRGDGEMTAGSVITVYPELVVRRSTARLQH
ncbi:LacI family DNA-binding transcriptional regulator [Acidicapsa dinghuensis]|uniref:LacI family DNA-binding transcriptional regulator n=1 Tax=Acidicapsa dinghuensis TaxID=2218256 RepID=A0ABW1EEP3_9BACT|nr:LacI family DNA-binding transcriptional regulator [Acidicapsa dinghuensis]